MSYILDALRKADQDRAIGNVPDLESVHETGSPVRRNYRWVWILVVLLVFNGALMAMLMLVDDGVPEHATVDAADAGLADEAAKSAVPAVSSRPARQSSSSYQPPKAAPVLPESRPVAKNSYRPPARKPVSQAAETGKVIVATAPDPVPEVDPVHAPARPTAPKAAKTRPARTSGGLPDWDELPLEFRSGFDAPHMDVHVYDTNPQRRFILVNLRKYREGDRLESGAVLEKINLEGIQLSYQGKQFLYRK